MREQFCVNERRLAEPYASSRCGIISSFHPLHGCTPHSAPLSLNESKLQLERGAEQGGPSREDSRSEGSLDVGDNVETLGDSYCTPCPRPPDRPVCVSASVTLENVLSRGAGWTIHCSSLIHKFTLTALFIFRIFGNGFQDYLLSPSRGLR